MFRKTIPGLAGSTATALTASLLLCAGALPTLAQAGPETGGEVIVFNITDRRAQLVWRGPSGMNIAYIDNVGMQTLPSGENFELWVMLQGDPPRPGWFPVPDCKVVGHQPGRRRVEIQKVVTSEAPFPYRCRFH